MGKKETRTRRTYFQETILSKYRPNGPFEFVLILNGLKASYNVAKIIRSANAFGCREVHLIQIGVFDPSPAQGSLRYTRCLTFDSFDASYQRLKAEGYTFFAFDVHTQNTLADVKFPNRSAFILGHESKGLRINPADYPEIRFIKIPQFGIVESLNVSVAASLAAYEYVRQRDFCIPESAGATPDKATPPPRLSP